MKIKTISFEPIGIIEIQVGYYSPFVMTTFSSTVDVPYRSSSTKWFCLMLIFFGDVVELVV